VVAVSGFASVETLRAFIYETKKLGIYAIVDMIRVENPAAKLHSLKEPSEIVLVHRAIDVEKKGGTVRWDQIQAIRSAFKEK
jgi:3-keto-L-gulonate-6-phosphate decarboxylase